MLRQEDIAQTTRCCSTPTAFPRNRRLQHRNRTTHPRAPMPRCRWRSRLVRSHYISVLVMHGERPRPLDPKAAAMTKTAARGTGNGLPLLRNGSYIFQWNVTVVTVSLFAIPINSFQLPELSFRRRFVGRLGCIVLRDCRSLVDAGFCLLEPAENLLKGSIGRLAGAALFLLLVLLVLKRPRKGFRQGSVAQMMLRCWTIWTLMVTLTRLKVLLGWFRARRMSRTR